MSRIHMSSYLHNRRATLILGSPRGIVPMFRFSSVFDKKSLLSNADEITKY